MMDAAARFVSALEAARLGSDSRLLPDRLVRAAAAVLPVAGVGLAVHSEGLRLPLAASSASAATAERLEFTAGCGPGLAATVSGVASRATEGLLARRWPIFHDLLVTRTSLRGVLALPLPGGLRGFAGMDLYFRDPAGPTARGVVEAPTVARLIAERLEVVARLPAATDTGEPRWLATASAHRRARVWLALGMMIAALQLNAGDALALLRAHAFATDRTVDELAADLVARRIGPDELGEPARARRESMVNRQPDHGQRGGTRRRNDVSADSLPARDGHMLLLHRGEEERRAELTVWVRRGLELGEKVMCAERADVPGGGVAALFAALEGGGVDVAAAVRAGRLAVLAAEQVCRPESASLVVERALAEGFPAARLSIDASAAPGVLPAAEHRESERWIDELSNTRQLSVMCQYARATTTADRLADLVAEHPTRVLESTLETRRNGDGLVLCGEIDIANAEVLAALLTAADHVGSCELQLDLRGVTYLDAGAGRRLNEATRGFRAAGGRVVLVGPQPAVERTLELLDLGDLPGMELSGAGR